MTTPDYTRLHAEILAHPGMRYLNALATYSTSKNILSGNAYQLRKLLEVLEDPSRAPALWALDQRKRLRDLQGEAIRHFHNFVAAVHTLADHTRVLMDEDFITAEHRNEYDSEVKKVFADDPLSRFLHDMRNYMLHRSIPITEIELSLHEDGDRTDSYVHIDLVAIAEWTRWKPQSRVFIEAHKPKIRMSQLVDEYEEKARGFHKWFCLRFQKYYERQIDDVLALQRKWNDGLRQEPTTGSSVP